MSTIEGVERRIRRVEGFRVRVKHLDGRDVRGDRTGMPQYPYERAAADTSSVKHWRDTRFRPHFPGFEVDVLLRSGEVAHGLMLLETVRDGYP